MPNDLLHPLDPYGPSELRPPAPFHPLRILPFSLYCIAYLTRNRDASHAHDLDNRDIADAFRLVYAFRYGPLGSCSSIMHQHVINAQPYIILRVLSQADARVLHRDRDTYIQHLSSY